ncbi:MAG: serine/threonine protein kinase [Polyangiaceae bacterium]|nr:serine/threonine protein kinase [Polyangiaceae bacterium]
MNAPAPGQEGLQRRTRLGRYDLIAQLGSGGMADVYLGVARGPAGFNKLVVLKVLRAQFAHDGEFLTFGVEEDGGRFFLVMEYLEGHPLASLDSQPGEMPLPAAVRVLADVLSGLHYAHELTDLHGQPLGIVHRDVSPQNVFVTYDGPAKLLDFGVAKARNALSQTQDGAIKGKVRYMAPEQVNGEAVDRRSDVFAAGILLWRMATGKKLWEGFDQLSIMHRLVNGDPVPSPRAVRPDVPHAIDAICVKALSLPAEERFQTAAEFVTALEEFLQSSGALGTHRAVARFLEAKHAAERAKFQAFVDERLRALEGQPLDRASSFGGFDSRGWQLPFVGEEEHSGGSLARGVVTSSRPPSFGALSDFPESRSSGRPPVGVPHSPSFSAIKPSQRPARRPWPVVFAFGGLGLGALAIVVPLLLRSLGSKVPSANAPANPSALLAPSPSPRGSATAARTSASVAASVASVPSASASPVLPAEPQGGRGADGSKGPKPRRPRPGASATPFETTDPPPVKVPDPPAHDPCESPYFVDERGVKKIKPECL